MSTQSKKRDVKNLEKYQRDIMDDSGDINEINRQVSILKTDFQDFLISNRTNSILRKMDSLNELSQQSDTELINASNNITKEINELNKEISAETAAAQAAKQTRELMYGSGGYRGGGGFRGGGGTW